MELVIDDLECVDPYPDMGAISNYLNNKLYNDPEFFGDFGPENIISVGEFEQHNSNKTHGSIVTSDPKSSNAKGLRVATHMVYWWCVAVNWLLTLWRFYYMTMIIILSACVGVVSSYMDMTK